MDVTEESAVATIFASLRGSGGLDILINNAGVSSMNPVALTPLSTARRIVEVNFLGAFLFTRGAVRLLRNSEHGRIVNITTIAVPLGLEGEAVYAASKGALEVFTRVVAKEVGQFGITCNAVGPAPVDTRLTRQVPPDKIDALIAQQAIRLHAEPRDVINVVDFFLRPESRLVTAQVLYLGGFG
jgi:3-oxoacyl-[acyl-carrier protein] reductase